MNLANLTTAIQEAERFLERAKVLHDILRASDRRQITTEKTQ